MTNLLQETIKDIEKSGHEVSDITFIGSLDSGYSCTWGQFLTLADIEYGGQEIASDLTIVFGDGSTMWRAEYDGSERWEYSKPVEIPEKQKQILKLTGGIWGSLKDLHENSLQTVKEIARLVPEPVAKKQKTYKKG